MLKIISIMMTVWKMEMLIQKIFCWWWCWCWWCWWGQCRCLWGILHPTWLRSRGSSGSWELLAPHNATALNQIIFINTYWKWYHSIQEWTRAGRRYSTWVLKAIFPKKKVSKSSVSAKLLGWCEDSKYVKKLSSILYVMHSAHLAYLQTKEVL